MVKSNKHVEIVRSGIIGLSSIGQESCDAVYKVLSKHFTRVGVTIINNMSDLEALIICRPDLVFLGMESIPRSSASGLSDPDKIWLSTYLDDNNIAYTGSGQIAHELQRNKPLAKQRVLDSGLKTSAFYVIRQNQLPHMSDIPLTFPLFIKPTNRGGGLGIDSKSVAYNFKQLCEKVNSISTELGSDSLIEEYLPGREFSVAILQDEHSVGFLVMPIELIAPINKQGARLLTEKVKSSNAERAVEVTGKSIRSSVAELAINVFYALGARDYGRIDIRLDKLGTPQFLEANLIPSLISGYGSFPKACVLNVGLGYEQMIMKIVRLGLARSKNNVEEIHEINIVNNTFSRTALEIG